MQSNGSQPRKVRTLSLHDVTIEQEEDVPGWISRAFEGPHGPGM